MYNYMSNNYIRIIQGLHKHLVKTHTSAYHI